MIKFDRIRVEDEPALLQVFIDDIDSRFSKIEEDSIIYYNGLPIYDLPRSSLEKALGLYFYNREKLSERLCDLSRERSD